MAFLPLSTLPMSFTSLDRLLNQLQREPGWEKVQGYQEILNAWRETMGSSLKDYAYPLALRQRVLWIATASPVWAQTLTLQRRSLLQKLNPLLREPLQDLRFSPYQWHQRPGSSASTSPNSAQPWDFSAIAVDDDDDQEYSDGDRVQQAFARWIQVLEYRAQQLPACPQCRSPTQPRDLERWGLCSSCVRQRWSKKMSNLRD